MCSLLFYWFIKIPHTYWIWILCGLHVLQTPSSSSLWLIFFMFFIASFNEEKVQTKISGTLSFLVISLSSLLYILVKYVQTQKRTSKFSLSTILSSFENWISLLLKVTHCFHMVWKVSYPASTFFPSSDTLWDRNRHQWHT